MFGHNEDQQTTNQPAPEPASVSPGGDGGVVQEPIMHDGSLEEPTTVTETPSVGYSVPPVEQTNDNQQDNDDAMITPLNTSTVDSGSTFTPPVMPTSGDGNNVDLLDIKQKALQDLSPLMQHLEQNPEEKFRTTMMMIQASDNKDLLPEAYSAAQAIVDDKARAQALLDVINEINYFTQASND